MKVPSSAPQSIEDCATLRLAQGDIATVDMCSCGTLRLNLGAVTLRLTPEALSSVLQTVAEALATHTALRARPRFAAARAPSSTAKTKHA